MLARVKSFAKKRAAETFMVLAWAIGGFNGYMIGTLQAKPYTYPGAVQTSFLVQCIGDKAWLPAAHDFCHCALREIQLELSYKEFLEEVKKPASQQDQSVATRIEECKSKIQQSKSPASPESDYIPM